MSERCEIDLSPGTRELAGDAEPCPPSSQPALERRRRGRSFVAVLHDHRRLQRDSLLRAPPAARPDARRARRPRPAGISSGASASPRMIRSFTRSYTGVPRVSTTPAASTALRAHDGALVHAAVAADEHVVLDHDRRGIDRLEHAADLRGGAQVHALADLRARADQRVRVDHRARADHAPTFTYIGGMQTTPGARYAPRRTDEPPGHEAHAAGQRSSPAADRCACRRKAERPRSIPRRPTCPRLARRESRAGCRA